MRTNKVVIVCGAGISVSSGIPTYRSQDGGLWNIHDMKEICVKGRELDPKSIQFYDSLRQKIKKSVPSDVHRTIADIQQKLGEDRCVIFTQNVDDLLERAGCTKVCHVHGIVDQARCTGCNMRIKIHDNTESIENDVCKSCSNRMRYDIVYYREHAPEYEHMIETLVDMENEDLFVMIGTSCEAIPIDNIVRVLKMRKVYVNPIVEPNIDITYYQHVLLNKAEYVIDDLQNIILNYIK